MNNEQNKHEKDRKPNHTARRIGALAVALYIAVAAGAQTIEWSKEGVNAVGQQFEEIANPCLFSAETSIYCLKENEGFLAAVEQVQGHENFDKRQIVHYIEDMPQNKSITENGRIPQIGEAITVPASVTQR